jgi:hypothetical protein
VARLTSFISSSLRTKRRLGEVLSEMSAAGSVDADVLLPISEKLNPAAPNAVTAAALVLRFCFEARLMPGMAASSLN